jgi:RND family efflux transporter MFP subunit
VNAPLITASARQGWSWRRRSGFAVLLAALLAGGWYYAFYVPSVAVTRLERGLAVTAIYASGTVEPTVQLKIAPKLTGRLTALLVDEHAEVQAGQVLARLDDQELAANLAQVQARLELAEREASRAQALLSRGTGTAQQRDKAASTAREARAALAAATRQRAEYTLLAPAAGTIIRRDGEVGEIITANQAVFMMACCAPLRITAQIDEEDVPLVQVGQKALLRADAFPGRTFTGTVTAMTPKGDATARSFRVRLALPDDSPLLIGMTVEVNIIAHEQPDAWLLPPSAVRDGKVWVLQDGRLQQKSVTATPTASSRLAVTAGLTPDDHIVLKPQPDFKAGDRRRALPAAAFSPEATK